MIRHGLPEHVETEDGSPADPPLSAEGHIQAQKMAAWLKDTKIDRLYASPMQRAYQTSLPLAEIKQLEPELNEGVAEYDRHADHYIPVEKLKELDYERWLQLMKGELEDVNFPEFCTSVIQSMEQIVEENRGRTVAVVCHGGVINIWTAHVLGMELKMFFNPRYTSINRYMAASSGERSIITLNEHSHLIR